MIYENENVKLRAKVDQLVLRCSRFSQCSFLRSLQVFTVLLIVSCEQPAFIELYYFSFYSLLVIIVMIYIFFKLNNFKTYNLRSS